MSRTDIGSWLWAAVTIVGPLLLAFAILWAIVRHRRPPPGPGVKAARKAAVHDLYRKDAGQPRGR